MLKGGRDGHARATPDTPSRRAQEISITHLAGATRAPNTTSAVRAPVALRDSQAEERDEHAALRSCFDTHTRSGSNCRYGVRARTSAGRLEARQPHPPLLLC